MVLPNPFLPMQKPVSAVFKTSFPKMTFGLSAAKSINHSWWPKITEIAKPVFMCGNGFHGSAKPVFANAKAGFRGLQNQFSKNDFWFKRDKIN